MTALTGDGRGRLLASVSVGWFFILGMRFVVPGLLPTITDSFGVSDTRAGVAVTVLWATYALMQSPAGYYVDRLGERTLLVAGLLVGGAGLAAYAVTPTFGLFVAATGVFGFGTGLYGPARGTVVSKVYDENDGAAFGAVLAAGSVGAAALPAGAAAVVDVVGWRATFGAALPAFLVAAVAIWWTVPPARPDDGESSDLRVALRDAATAVRDRRVALAVTGAGLMLFVFQAASAFLTTYLVDSKGLSQQTAGALFGLLFVVGAGFQWSGGHLADRFGAPRVLTAVSAVSVLPLLLLPVVEGVPAVTLIVALLGVRLSIGPISNAYVVDVLPDAVQGTAWGAIRTSIFLVASLGSTMVGVLADVGAFDAAFYLLAGLTAVGALVYHRLPERP